MTLLGTVKLVQTTSVYLLVTFWSKYIKYAIFTAFSFFFCKCNALKHIIKHRSKNSLQVKVQK